jgi:hypothetical protein
MASTLAFNAASSTAGESGLQIVEQLLAQRPDRSGRSVRRIGQALRDAAQQSGSTASILALVAGSSVMARMRGSNSANTAFIVRAGAEIGHHRSEQSRERTGSTPHAANGLRAARPPPAHSLSIIACIALARRTVARRRVGAHSWQARADRGHVVWVRSLVTGGGAHGMGAVVAGDDEGTDADQRQSAQRRGNDRRAEREGRGDGAACRVVGSWSSAART